MEPAHCMVPMNAYGHAEWYRARTPIEERVIVAFKDRWFGDLDQQNEFARYLYDLVAGIERAKRGELDPVRLRLKRDWPVFRVIPPVSGADSFVILVGWLMGDSVEPKEIRRWAQR